MLEIIGTISTVISVIGVICNNRRLRACFLLWLVSNSLSLIIGGLTGVYSLVVRDGIFIFLAVEGWLLWGRHK